MYIKTIIIAVIHLLNIVTLSGSGGNEVSESNLYGRVTTSDDGLTVPFINLIIEGTRIGTFTDASGMYRLKELPSGRHTLVAKGMGFEIAKFEFEIEPGQSLELNLEVAYRGIDLEEIVVTSSPTARGFRYQPDNVFLGEELQRRSEISF